MLGVQSTSKDRWRQAGGARLLTNRLASTLAPPGRIPQKQPGRGCVEDQPQQAKMKRTITMNPLQAEELTRCDWCFAHSRAPFGVRRQSAAATALFGWMESRLGVAAT